MARQPDNIDAMFEKLAMCIPDDLPDHEKAVAGVGLALSRCIMTDIRRIADALEVIAQAKAMGE